MKWLVVSTVYTYSVPDYLLPSSFHGVSAVKSLSELKYYGLTGLGVSLTFRYSTAGVRSIFKGSIPFSLGSLLLALAMTWPLGNST